MKAPKTYNGKTLRFEVVFRLPFVRTTEEVARKVLDFVDISTFF